ncbi:MAG: cytochrome c peroxidase [Aliishimia sp.]
MIRAVCVFLILASPLKAEVLLSQDEIAQTLLHGPWPPAIESDPSNRMSGDAGAIAVGEALFSDPILSRDMSMSCASCHDPEQGFSDGLIRSKGRTELDRNAPTLWNLRWNRWFGRGGDTDSLWAHSILPMAHPDEMDHTPDSLHAALADSDYLPRYEALFGPLGESKETLVNVAKVLASYQETLITTQTPFDGFRDALERGDMVQAATYPAAAQRGLQLFLGRGNCNFCHLGPMFSNGEFHDAGVPYFIDETRVDQGRFGGLKALLRSPFTLAGEYSDDPDKTGAWAVEQVRPLHSDFGTFRVPGLRNVAKTAPYMHNGSLADLTAVVQHYDKIDLERLHADGELILRPLHLTALETADLVSFLESLTSP